MLRLRPENRIAVSQVEVSSPGHEGACRLPDQTFEGKQSMRQPSIIWIMPPEMKKAEISPLGSFSRSREKESRLRSR
jgi:hypothetical protein